MCSYVLLRQLETKETFLTLIADDEHTDTRLKYNIL